MTELGALIVGSAAGGMARHALVMALDRRLGERFPWGTLAVNVSGAFGIGLLAAAAAARGGLLDAAAWLLLVAGFLGSYTTVSSFSLQTLALVRAGEHARAALNVVLSVGACLGVAALAYALGAGVLFPADTP